MPLDKLLEIGMPTCAGISSIQRSVAKELEPGKDSAAGPRRTRRTTIPRRISCSDRFAHLRRIDSTSSDPADHHHPIGCAADCRGDAALHARHHVASMDTPGPYEKVAKEAYFNVTLPEPSWLRSAVEGFMTPSTRGTIIRTAVHEAYPGHYVQFLWMPQAPVDGPQAARRQHQRRGLGALLRTDDAR